MQAQRGLVPGMDAVTGFIDPRRRNGVTENAQMAKLVDALVSGTSVSNDVQVRVLFWALA